MKTELQKENYYKIVQNIVFLIINFIALIEQCEQLMVNVPAAPDQCKGEIHHQRP